MTMFPGVRGRATVCSEIGGGLCRALPLHDEPTSEIPLAVLEPVDMVPSTAPRSCRDLVGATRAADCSGPAGVFARRLHVLRYM